MARTMIEFHLDPRSGVAPYLQIVQQVKEALRLGMLDVGDQLPTVREVVADLAINPNTVAKAYRELEASGLVEARRAGARSSPARSPLPRRSTTRRSGASSSAGSSRPSGRAWTRRASAR